MKQAKVVPVRDVAPADSAPTRDGDYQKRQHIEALLRCYPDTREAESKEIITFLATGNHLDVGLVSDSDEFARPTSPEQRSKPLPMRWR